MSLKMKLQILESGAVILEKYQIIEEIGRGGMGIVYLATDLRLEREVALKELIIGNNTDESEIKGIIDRFIKEARIAAKLNHPNIVTIFDVFDDNERYFIAMEYLQGETLKNILDGAKIF